MIIKNELEMERIFSYAVALDQSGRQKNTIWGWKNIIYIINSDKTVILRFESSQDVFKDPIGFYAANYVSSDFNISGEFIIYFQDNTGGWTGQKTLLTPLGSFREAEDLFYKYFPENLNFPYITFHKDALKLLDENLSHIEFKVTKGKPNILQRDIYAGSTILLERPKSTGLGLIEYEDKVPQEIPPIGMRTNDFLSLFNFNEEVKIYFPNENGGYFVVEGTHNSMLGIIGGCLYDDIGTIQTVEEVKDGRKIQEDRVDEQEVDRKDNRQILRRRIK